MFTDRRSKKIAVIANCILNQNAKADAFAQYPAMTPGIVELLNKYNFGIHQAPCPEIYATGIRRFWATHEQYNNRGTRRAFEEAAYFLLDQIEDFITHGFKVILIGIDGSPSCGIDFTDTDINGIWLGKPDLTDASFTTDFAYKKSPGVFIKAIQKELTNRELQQLPSFGLNFDISNETLDLSKLEDFLKTI